MQSKSHLAHGSSLVSACPLSCAMQEHGYLQPQLTPLQKAVPLHLCLQDAKAASVNLPPLACLCCCVPVHYGGF